MLIQCGTGGRIKMIKSGFLTRLLFPAERLALLCPAHCEDVHQVLGVCGETCQGEVVP